VNVDSPHIARNSADRMHASRQGQARRADSMPAQGAAQGQQAQERKSPNGAARSGMVISAAPLGLIGKPNSFTQGCALG
jgi:hypothetical protein